MKIEKNDCLVNNWLQVHYAIKFDCQEYTQPPFCQVYRRLFCQGGWLIGQIFLIKNMLKFRF